MLQREPFPHAVSDGMWDSGLLRKVAAEMPALEHPGWKSYKNDREHKFEGPSPLWGLNTCELADQLADRAGDFATMFDTPRLWMESVGGGYHVIPPGGYLAVHADFNRSPRTGRYRRLNVLVFLNEHWTDDDGGHLELWDTDGPAVSVLPVFNRTVVFETSSTSFHGHPTPLPASRPRRSFATYFFTDEPPHWFEGEHSTVFHA